MGNPRQGIVFDKWPLRLDVAYEYQCWILIAVSLFCLSVCMLPCLCGVLKGRLAKRFTIWVYSRLHTFFCVAFYFNLTLLIFTIGLLPDWTVNEFVSVSFDLLDWVLVNTVKLLTSSTILIALYILVRFKERIAVAAGVEHMTFLRLGKWNLFHSPLMRGIEVIIWKVEELPSGSGLKPNDVFLECHVGQNEPSRTRVHNNAGSSAIQVNIDENDPEELFTVLVKDQELLVSSVLCKLQVRTKDILAVEASTGRVSEDFVYDASAFSQLQLQPRGRIWLRVNPLEEEKVPLTSGLC
ncbi:unnamed protein product [Amoebophrya sp. A25]|nr:unnamed protein product [Amoebophrya sp. A25]|eukprot:GSA25T00020189001.1